jgi:uncharacterized membrane protein YbhN (UPF0104 family)
VVAAVAYAIDWAELGRLLSRIKPHDIALIALASLAGHVIGAARFKLLCDPVVRLPLLTHARQYFVSACFGLFLPSMVGGDGVRIVMLTQSGARASQATTLVLSERLIGVVSLLLVSAGGALASDLPGWSKAVLCGTALGALLGLELVRRLGSRFTPKHAGLASAVDAVRRALAFERTGPVLLASVAYQGSVVATTALVGWTLSLGVPWSLVFALTPLVWFATMVPVSLGGIGMREGGFLVVFGWASVEPEPALLLSLGTYAGLVSVGLAGALWFFAGRLRPSTAPP